MTMTEKTRYKVGPLKSISCSPDGPDPTTNSDFLFNESFSNYFLKESCTYMYSSNKIRKAHNEHLNTVNKH